MAKEDTIKIVAKLNNGASKIKTGLIEIKSTIPVNDEIDTHVWRIEKEIKLLHKAVLKEVSKLDTNAEFKIIIDQLQGEVG